MGTDVKLRRIYDPPSPQDGYRVLVDRIWPRGVSREDASINLWLKEIAPSFALRKWFAHDAAKWAEFLTRYQSELEQNQDAVAELEHTMREGQVTLLYAARDEEHNNAVALRHYLASRKKYRRRAECGTGAAQGTDV